MIQQETAKFIARVDTATDEELVVIKDALRRRQEFLAAQRELINIELSMIQHSFEVVAKKLRKDPTSKIQDWKSRLFISDHALLRYLERAECRDLNKLRKLIISRLPDVILSGTPAIRVGNLTYRISYSDDTKISIATVIKSNRR